MDDDTAAWLPHAFCLSFKLETDASLLLSRLVGPWDPWVCAPILVHGAAGLGKTLAESPSTTQCVSARALEYATGLGSEDVSPWVEDLDKQFAASGYGIRALFLKVATMPETWQVKATPLDQGTTKLSFAGQRR